MPTDKRNLQTGKLCVGRHRVLREVLRSVKRNNHNTSRVDVNDHRSNFKLTTIFAKTITTATNPNHSLEK